VRLDLREHGSVRLEGVSLGGGVSPGGEVLRCGLRGPGRMPSSSCHVIDDRASTPSLLRGSQIAQFHRDLAPSLFGPLLAYRLDGPGPWPARFSMPRDTHDPTARREIAGQRALRASSRGELCRTRGSASTCPVQVSASKRRGVSGRSCRRSPGRSGTACSAPTRYLSGGPRSVMPVTLAGHAGGDQACSQGWAGGSRAPSPR
jgi:hypothetical protein